MKKLYTLLAMLLLLVGGASTARADGETVITISKATGYWTAWNGNESSPWAQTWVTSSENPRITITNANNNMSYNGDNLIFYNSVGGGTDTHTYTLSVSSGWYLKAVELDFVKNDKFSNSPTYISIALNGDDAVQNESLTDPVHVATGELTDNVSSIEMVVSSDVKGAFAETSNFQITVVRASELEMAEEELRETFNAYNGYRTDYFTEGTEPGQVSAEALEALAQALDAADVDNAEFAGAETVEEYQALSQAIIDAYNAVRASTVPLKLADGVYRIKTAMQYYVEGDDGTLQYYDKYMVSRTATDGTIYPYWLTPDDLTSEARGLWRLTNNEDGTIDLFNLGSETRFTKTDALNTALTMTADANYPMTLDPVATVDGVTYTNIRLADHEPYSYYYLHQYAHSSGTGTGNLLVIYYSTLERPSNTPAASEWVFEAVGDEEVGDILAAWEIIRAHNQMVSDYEELRAEARTALENSKDIDHRVDLITENSQFSSPWTSTAEGSLNDLLDGNTGTYWHSDWSTSVPNHTHYLQVALAEPVGQEIYLTIARRTYNGSPVASDHITLWGVYGSTDPEADEDEWVKLASLSTPYNSSVLTGITTDFFDPKNYKYLRFYIDDTTTGRGYGHVGEFQLSWNVYKEISQYYLMGDVATNLEKILKEQASIEAEDVDQETYDRLKEAYDAFKAAYVDPTELRNLLTELAEKDKSVVLGTNPGFWESTEGIEALKQTIAEAQAYDKAGAYVAATSQGYIDKLKAQAEAIDAAAIGIKEGKWYRIRFATEEEFEKYEWDTVAGDAQVVASDGADIVTSQSLFGKYIAVANVVSETQAYTVTDEESGEVSENEATIYSVEAANSEDVTLGHNLFFQEKEDIEEADLALFRFVAVGDSAYLLQNKGTNLFLKAAGESGAVSLNVHPSLFKVSAIGYGENLIAAQSITGDGQNYLHGQVTANMLVTWNATTPGSRSALYIEEAEDVASDYAGEEFNMSIVPGKIYPLCYPVNMPAVEGMYGVSVEDNKVTLFPITTEATAGRPFVFIEGDLDDYDAEAEAEISVLKHGYKLVTEPQTNGVLKGTFSSITLDRGEAYAEGNTFVVNHLPKDAVMDNNSISANQAYLAPEGGFEVGSVLEIVVDTTMEDGIAEAIASVSKSGAVYTLDGRLVSRKASLSDLSRYGKGLYILNGVKVIVK